MRLDCLGHAQDPDWTMEEAVACQAARGTLGRLASWHSEAAG